MADVTDLDLGRKIVHASGPDGRSVELPYDTLVVAAGASHSFFGKDEFAHFAPGMKTIEDARHLRGDILSRFETAAIATNPAERAELLTFVVIGAGPTGVELAGQLAELAHLVLPQEYRTIDTTDARIILLEGASAVLPTFPRKLQDYTRTHLEKMGVDVRLNTLATDMDHESITVTGPKGVQAIRARTRIWAAGVQASPLATLLAEKTGGSTDRAGRVAVNPDCSLPGHPDVFAVGDMVTLNDLPGTAQPAIQQGRYVATLITARTQGEDMPQPFIYIDKGSMATIGHKAAVAHTFGRAFTGLTAYLMWGLVHITYLVGWGNRLGTMYNWARSMWFGTNRGHRIITFSTRTVEHHTKPSPMGGADLS
jgi:NADH:quinone reductase (non-electrogenic)